jgi:hypothetical protein
MSVESAQQDVKVSFGQDFVIMGTDRIEVSPDGKKVTAYTNDGVETKAASGAATSREGAISQGAVSLSRDGGISISADFNTVVLNGAIIKRAADGHLVISAPDATVKQAAPANNSAAKANTAIEIGDLDDGGVYVGLSAENGKPLHAALADLPDYKTYEDALAAAEQLKNLHPTARVPTPKELDKNLFDNRNAGHLKGTFNTSGPDSLYRSSASYNLKGSPIDYARVQWFDDGHQSSYFRFPRLPVRLVW